MRSLCVVLIAGCLSPVWAYAQSTASDPADTAPVRLGPVGLAPSITIAGFTDSNVFRDETGERQDFRITASPASRAWLRAGRSRFSVDGRLDFAYFRRYSGEGSLDGAVTARYEFRANRVTPWVEGRWVHGRQRVGYEIDARARRGERARGGGVNVQLRPKTEAGVFASDLDYRYDAQARFVGTDLRDALNRRSTALGVQVSQRLTPFTTFVVQAETIRDRFAFSTARDSDSRRVLAGFNLEPLALISGRVRVGYREFQARDGTTRFTGLVGTFDAAYTLLGRTRFTVVGQRELDYSYDVSSPYFIRAGAQLTVTTRVSSHWDVQGTLGRQALSYRQGDASRGRTDRYLLYGAGTGILFGDSLRIGFTAEREERQSAAGGRTYGGYRIGTGITVGG